MNKIRLLVGGQLFITGATGAAAACDIGRLELPAVVENILIAAMLAGLPLLLFTPVAVLVLLARSGWSAPLRLTIFAVALGAAAAHVVALTPTVQ